MESNESTRVVLVTGAGGGVGKVVATTFAADGYHVLANGRNEARAAEIVTQLSAECPNGRFTPMPGDVTSQQSIAEMFTRISTDIGQLNAFVDCTTPSGAPRSNAPIRHGRFTDLDPATFEATVVSALVPVYTLCHYALPVLKAAGGGAIVTYATDAGKVALPGQIMTGPLRAGLMMFTRTLAMEVSGDQIRVNCVSPTYIRDTPIFDRVMAGGPDSRAATATKRAKLGLPSPIELAQLTLFLCSAGAAQLTGQVISVNGGLSAA